MQPGLPKFTKRKGKGGGGGGGEREEERKLALSVFNKTILQGLLLTHQNNMQLHERISVFP